MWDAARNGGDFSQPLEQATAHGLIQNESVLAELLPGNQLNSEIFLLRQFIDHRHLTVSERERTLIEPDFSLCAREIVKSEARGLL